LSTTPSPSKGGVKKSGGKMTQHLILLRLRKSLLIPSATPHMCEGRIKNVAISPEKKKFLRKKIKKTNTASI
jgi:hypothetical protein